MTATELVNTGATLVPEGTWQVDRGHSAITFEVVDHEYARVINGRFTDFEGSAETVDGTTSLRGAISTPSLTTEQEQRDAHLRSPDFLDTETSPEIRFESTAIEPIGESRFVLVGRLAIRELEQELRLEAEQLVTGTGLGGSEQAAVRAGGALDFGPYRVSVSASITFVREA